ncbi:hypothetical protein IF2G_09309 [Cordyceps javanica]|nr:hypothetical protein IF2G_09309 [Cordyceps javanica]
MPSSLTVKPLSHWRCCPLRALATKCAFFFNPNDLNCRVGLRAQASAKQLHSPTFNLCPTSDRHHANAQFLPISCMTYHSQERNRISHSIDLYAMFRNASLPLRLTPSFPLSSVVASPSSRRPFSPRYIIKASFAQEDRLG